MFVVTHDTGVTPSFSTRSNTISLSFPSSFTLAPHSSATVDFHLALKLPEKHVASIHLNQAFQLSCPRVFCNTVIFGKNLFFYCIYLNLYFFFFCHRLPFCQPPVCELKEHFAHPNHFLREGKFNRHSGHHSSFCASNSCYKGV